MPNWCNNDLILKHADKAQIDKALAAFKEGKLLETFVPVPEALKETMAGHYGDPYKRELHEFTQQLNIKYFGYANWYDFAVAEWGTKWDIGGRDNTAEQLDDNTIVLTFESAWSPPIAAYEKLQALGFDVTGYYWEPGMCFCGRFDGEGDFYLEGISGSEDAAQRVPRDIDERMNITQQLTEWEQENDE